MGEASSDFLAETGANGPIGILMLDSRFPRPVGDIGNPASFSFPVRYRVVEGAFPDDVVRHDPARFLPAFLKAAEALVAEGAVAISTSCGFLTLFQRELEAALPVPVRTSALLDVATIEAALPAGRRAGILTISAASLTARHLEAAGVARDAPVGTTEGGREFTRAILDNERTLDPVAAEADNVRAALALQAAHPELGAIVLECTNMGPYGAAISAATGLPVHSVITMLERLYNRLQAT